VGWRDTGEQRGTRKGSAEKVSWEKGNAGGYALGGQRENTTSKAGRKAGMGDYLLTGGQQIRAKGKSIYRSSSGALISGTWERKGNPT